MALKGYMKVVGDVNRRPYAERFNRLQRRATLILPGGVCPRGVFRFRSYEEFERWKWNLALNRRRGSPIKST